MPPSRFLTVLNTFVRDLRASVRLAADARSRFRLSMDFALSRFIGLVPSLGTSAIVGERSVFAVTSRFATA